MNSGTSLIIKVAVLAGSGAEEMAAALRGEEDFSPEILRSVEGDRLKGYSVLVVPMTGTFDEQAGAEIVRYVDAGGRAMLLYGEAAFGDAQKMLLFPTIVKGMEAVKDRVVKPIREYGIAAGMEPFEVRCPQVALHRGSEGVVFLRNGGRRNAGILGKYGQGKVLALGFSLGVNDIGEGIPLSDHESKLLVQALRWLASEERYEVPKVYIEARTLPELPKRASRVKEERAPEGKRFRAGASRVDITPSGSVTMRGFGNRRSTGVHDRLHVRALVLDNGDDSLAIVSWEKLNAYELPLSFDKMVRIRKEIHERVGIPLPNILINCTHTHSGCEGPFEEASVEAVTQAWENRKDARIGMGSKMIYGIGSSRRLPDGTGLWGSDQPNPDGVMDNECGVIRVEDDQRNLIAVVVHYTSHPSVLNAGNTRLSGDYAGIGMAEVERRLGGEVVALFLQGCAGDVGTHTFRKSRTIPEAERLGGRFADEVIQILNRIDVVPWVRLKAQNRMIDLPQREPQKPEKGVTIPPVPGDGIPNEVQALVIGDGLLLAVGSMEAYVEIGLDLKEASRFRHTFVLGYSNGPWLGYLPSNWGYSVNDPDAQGTRFAPEAPDALVRECLRLHDQVRG